MVNKIKLSLMSLLAFGLFVAPIAVVQSTVSGQADIQSSLCEGADLQFGGDSDCTQDGEVPEERINTLIADIVDIISVIVGIVAVIMIIYGGFRYITSGGDSGNVSNAKNTILYAIIGLIIVALAQFIVKFVLNTSNGLTE